MRNFDSVEEAEREAFEQCVDALFHSIEEESNPPEGVAYVGGYELWDAREQRFVGGKRHVFIHAARNT